MSTAQVIDFETGDPREEIAHPPANFEGEQGLLGQMLADNRVVAKVRDVLLPEHFFDPVHGRIYSAILHEMDAGRGVDAVTLKAYFDRDQSLKEVGGAQYLVRLMGSLVCSGLVNGLDYANTIRECWVRRQMTEVGHDLIARGNNPSFEESDIGAIGDAEKRLKEIGLSATDPDAGLEPAGTGAAAFIARAEQAYKAEGRMLGLSTGLVDLDRLIGGLLAPDFLVIASRPSMGKSALAAGIARRVAEQDHPVAVFELEMSAEQLTGRLIAADTGVPYAAIRNGNVDQHQFQAMIQASHGLNALPLFIDDTPGLAVSTLAARARSMNRRRRLGLIVVDYLQLLKPTAGTRHSNRVSEVTDITATLKGLALELEVPILACAQLSRAVEQREDKRPQLSDLRESGSIEQDADHIFFLHRQEYYLSRLRPTKRTGEDDARYSQKLSDWHASLEGCKGLADLYCDKNRHGPTGHIELAWDAQRMRFGNRARVHETEGTML